MSTSYADSAQAREWDRRFDEWGKPRINLDEFTHDYDLTAERKRNAAERESLRRRIAATMAQMEKVCSPKGDPA
ncbi:hypothetical protein D3C86_1888860 [compost metagenome]